MARLLHLALFCALEVALAQPYKFILALPLDAASGYRESHSAACTRVGLQATPSRVLLAGSLPVAAFWNLSTISDIVTALGAPYALAAAPVAGCCSPSLWCSSGGGQCFTHAPLGADIAYENYGWLLGSPAVPVYTCQALPMDAASLAARAAATPFVASVGAAPTLYSTPSGLRLRLDGLQLGSDPTALAVSVGDAPCTNPAVCHTMCSTCRYASDCAPDKTCLFLSPGAPGRCLAPCASDMSCACGAKCYALSISRIIFNFCGDPAATNTSSLCQDGARRALWRPLAGGLTDRVECTLPTPLGSAAGSRALQALQAAPVPLPEDPACPISLAADAQGAAAPAPAPVSLWARAAAAAHLAAAAAGPRSLTSPAPYSTAALAPGATPGGSRHSGGVCAGAAYGGAGAAAGSAMPLGLFPLVLTRGSLASTGMAASLALAFGVLGNTSAGAAAAALAAAPPAQAGALAALGALGYTGFLPLYTATNASFQCTVDAQCPVVDATSVPACRPAASASLPPPGAGCCVYTPRGTFSGSNSSSSNSSSSSSSSASVLPSGTLPSPFNLYALPAAAAAALPLPPPPYGASGPPGGAMVNPALRNPALAPALNVWDARSPWWDPTTPAALASFPPTSTPYSTDFSPYHLQASSSVDDVPMGILGPLPFPVLFLGAPLNYIYASANGFLRTTASPPCNGSFSSAYCSFLNDYNAVVGPLMQDYNPGAYVDSEVWGGYFDATPLATALGFNASAASAPAAPAPAPTAQMACLAYVNMGLYLSPAPYAALPPAPGFNFFLCLHGDGGVRLRFGRILGNASEAVGRWATNATLLPPGGGGSGAPPGTAWASGMRGPARTFSDTRGSVGAALGRAWAGAPGQPSPASAADWAALGPTEALIARSGVRPGASAALCSVNPTACASPVCGAAGGGTVVRVRWSGLGCGLGLEALLGRTGVGNGGGGGGARLVCVFGSAPPSPATWVATPLRPRPAAAANSSSSSGNSSSGAAGSSGGGSTLYSLQCTAPPLQQAAAGWGGSALVPSANVTVPLRVWAVLPSDPRAYGGAGAGGGSRVVAGSEALLGAGLGVGAVESLLGLGRVTGAGVGEVSVPLGGSEGSLYGLEAVQLAGAGGATATVLTAVPLSFTYTLGSCGCSAASPSAACSGDGSNVCGGAAAAPPAVDCTGTFLGAAFLDACGKCSGGSSAHVPNIDMDCDGTCFGPNVNCKSSGGGGITPPPPAQAQDASDAINAGLLYVSLILCLVSGALCVFCTCVKRCVAQGQALDALARGDAEALGLTPGLSPQQRARHPLWDYASKSQPQAMEAAGGCETCNVCMEEFLEPAPPERPEVEQLRTLLPCKHVFHARCIDVWLSKSTLCPVCRAELRTAEEVAADLELRRRRAVMLLGAPQRGEWGGQGAAAVAERVASPPAVAERVASPQAAAVVGASPQGQGRPSPLQTFPWPRRPCCTCPPPPFARVRQCRGGRRG